ncbi:MAG TPA: chromate resistance protein ChrB domain-containing protein [Acidobacteriota bacterium]|nr:chromate resistance protein ChrB domain-containing protein [Acidobacteriota bacterium]
MKWVTREKVKVDRVACPWLIKKFVDPDAEFFFVQSEEVLAFAKRENAIPFDVPGLQLGHHNGKCSFEAIVEQYKISDPGMLRLARIVHGADVQEDLYGSPESPGLKAIAIGFSKLGMPDLQILDKEFPLYDALYAYCRSTVES